MEISYYCDKDKIETNAKKQLEAYSEMPNLEKICAFTDIHYCDEKAIPVGVAFSTTDVFYPLITGKDLGCGVIYLKFPNSYWLKEFDKSTHYNALVKAHNMMTDDGLGGGNHFLSIEKDDTDTYIICHTGSRNRGIEMFQHNYDLIKKYSLEYGKSVNYVGLDFIDESYYIKYNSILDFAINRRKNFVVKTLIFLQRANYIKCSKTSIDLDFLSRNYQDIDNHGYLNDTSYKIEDSIHNHIRFNNNNIIHRKGSTELYGNVVIPLSMTRGSLIVKSKNSDEALNSCAHGAGRKLSRFDAMKHWKTVLKEKERKTYKEQFSELLEKNSEFPNGYIQEFDFAYKNSDDILSYQPYLKLVTQTKPIITIKYTEI